MEDSKSEFLVVCTLFCSRAGARGLSPLESSKMFIFAEYSAHFCNLAFNAVCSVGVTVSEPSVGGSGPVCGSHPMKQKNPESPPSRTKCRAPENRYGISHSNRPSPFTSLPRGLVP